MRFSLLYEHQLPRPWDAGAEHRLLQEALAQVELADRLGFDTVWAAEHHFLEEHSHSSAPGVFLAAASQRTKNIRLGFGVLPLPPGYQHPARVAEAAATLDLVSDGRVELGTGEGSTGAELAGFGVDRATARAQWAEAIATVARMMVETPFAGVDGDHIKMPPRNVVPKPLQQPHPPLWVAATKRETIRLAAEQGIGALSFTFADPEETKAWVDEYYDIITSDRCVPAGFAINPNIAVALPMMVHADEAQAIERGIDGAHFFAYARGHYEAFGEHEPGRTSIWDEFLARREDVGFSRARHHRRRRAAGRQDPQQRPRLAARRDRHPRPGPRADRPLRAGRRRRADALRPDRQDHPQRHHGGLGALRRRGHAGVRAAPARAGGGQARAARRRAPSRAGAPRSAQGPSRAATRSRPTPTAPTRRRAPCRSRRPARSPARGGCRRPPSPPCAGPWRPAASRPFSPSCGARATSGSRAPPGRLPASRSSSPGWSASSSPSAPPASPVTSSTTCARPTARCAPGRSPSTATRATARPGASDAAKLTLTLSVADFVRIAGRDLDPVKAVLTGRLELAGDFSVAMRLGEMFGQPPPF